MITILIGLFLLGGLLTLTGAMKRTTGIQGNLETLHDSERLAMTIMTDVIQSAGFFPLTPANVQNATSTAAAQLPAIGTTWAAGQSILGTHTGTAAAPVDTISVRYLTGGGDGVINCTGATSTAAATWINTFQIDGNGNLQCVLTTGTAAPAGPVILVNGLNASGTNVCGAGVCGVQNLGVLYGVQTNTSSGTTSVDTYLTADKVTLGNYWGNVISVQITLYFANPLSGQPGQQNAPSQIKITRVIDLMNRAGP